MGAHIVNVMKNSIKTICNPHMPDSIAQSRIVEKNMFCLSHCKGEIHQQPSISQCWWQKQKKQTAYDGVHKIRTVSLFLIYKNVHILSDTHTHTYRHSSTIDLCFCSIEQKSARDLSTWAALKYVSNFGVYMYVEIFPVSAYCVEFFR